MPLSCDPLIKERNGLKAARCSQRDNIVQFQTILYGITQYGKKPGTVSTVPGFWVCHKSRIVDFFVSQCYDSAVNLIKEVHYEKKRQRSIEY